MNQHPYLRAYMAGIVVPTCFMLIVFTFFLTARFICAVPFPLERIIVFPLALVPNAFGVWNMLYLSLHDHRHLPLGFHGALLPLILAPSGLLVASSLVFVATTHDGFLWFDSFRVLYLHLAILFPIGVAIYYLVWKYIVGFLNEFLGIAR